MDIILRTVSAMNLGPDSQKKSYDKPTKNLG